MAEIDVRVQLAEALVVSPGDVLIVKADVGDRDFVDALARELSSLGLEGRALVIDTGGFRMEFTVVTPRRGRLGGGLDFSGIEGKDPPTEQEDP